MIDLDPTDKAILRLLQEDSTITIKEMAAQLHLSTTPIFDRMKKLEKSGVIKKYVALVDNTLVGKSLTIFINISIKEHGKDAIDEFIKEIIKFDEVMECHHVSGDSDFLIKLLLQDIASYNQFILDKLAIIPNIGKVESRFSLSERKNTTVIKI
ncbi:MAG: Lrp/AsnC family transcriptional regulator [Saprospiraceae bacterium]|nr:Lrp/AsnC family transcriptional regulator [Saprospiraceae bacterium]